MNENRVVSFCVSGFTLVLLVGILVVVSIQPDGFQDDGVHEYAVVFKPGTNHYKVIDKVLKSGGVPVRSGAFDFILIAASEDEAFLEYVKTQGAIFVFSPFVKGGCFVQNKTAFKRPD